ncbi:hypothetical protein [Nitrospirillum amazonense]|uniref:hypothetical protein n=1 Tax=Nitrospirillum amazonense TaxID=28077 RepID=UPI00241273A4|nr:hypothetical protein [Nitrospirillum amazonense]MDG3444582.1 hypothetical protein [Nitrospirillum amazonense]
MSIIQNLPDEWFSKNPTKDMFLVVRALSVSLFLDVATVIAGTFTGAELAPHTPAVIGFIQGGLLLWALIALCRIAYQLWRRRLLSRASGISVQTLMITVVCGFALLLQAEPLLLAMSGAIAIAARVWPVWQALVDQYPIPGGMAAGATGMALWLLVRPMVAAPATIVVRHASPAFEGNIQFTGRDGNQLTGL